MLTDYENLDDHLREEAEFADGEYRPYKDKLLINEHMFKKYSRPTNMWDWRELSSKLIHDFNGKELLDYGCGMGEESVYFARLGANVIGFDISQVGVNITLERALANGLQDKVHAQVMKAEDTRIFDDQQFDIVHGLGILHHVDLDNALTEVKRMLKPGGKAVFLEPMGNSAVIEAIKEWMMSQSDKFTDVTDDEENLKMKDVLRYKDEFKKLELYPYNFFMRVKRFIPRKIWTATRKLDYALLKTFPFLSYFAGSVVVYIEN